MTQPEEEASAPAPDFNRPSQKWDELYEFIRRKATDYDEWPATNRTVDEIFYAYTEKLKISFMTTAVILSSFAIALIIVLIFSTPTVALKHWDSHTSYSVGDIVVHVGSFYVATRASRNSSPSTAWECWTDVTRIYAASDFVRQQQEKLLHPDHARGGAVLDEVEPGNSSKF